MFKPSCFKFKFKTNSDSPRAWGGYGVVVKHNIHIKLKFYKFEILEY